jgi:hypothetical protein
MLRPLKDKINRAYFIEIKLTHEEELLELLSNSYHMTISEYIRFLIFKKLQKFKKFKKKGLHVL